MGSTAMMFKALADENRLLLLRLLLRRNCCVRALARQLDISEAAVSQHLKVLREAGLIFGEKCGYFMHYTVNRAAFKELSSQLSRMAFSAEQMPCTPQHGGCSRAEYDKCRNAAQPQTEHILHVAENRIFDLKGSMNMKIAVTYQNGLVFQHFGHSEAFKIYEIENGEVKNAEVAPTNGSGHGALAGFLKQHGVNALICGGIGGGARTALAEAGIELYPGVSGGADAAVNSLLNGTLLYNPDTVCVHHHHEGGHDCGSHSCGEDKHGCAGNH